MRRENCRSFGCARDDKSLKGRQSLTLVIRMEGSEIVCNREGIRRSVKRGAKVKGSGPSYGPLPPTTRAAALAAGFARICVGAFGLGRGLSHICAGFGCSVVLRPRAVIDLGGRVQPDQARTTAGSRSGRSS